MNRTTFEPSPLAQADYVAEGDAWTLVFVRELRHPPERVWAALTEPAQVGEWAPFTTDRDLGTPGDATLTMIDRDDSQDLAAQVTRAERPTLLEYRWGDDLLSWELDATESGTQLTLRHTVADRDFIAKAAAGWHLCVDVMEHLLDGDPIGPIRGSEAMDYGWQELHDAYARRL